MTATDPTVAAAEEEEYISSEDEDFNPDAANGEDEGAISDSSENDDDDNDKNSSAAAAKKTSRPKKRKSGPADAEAELDSGDEATIRKGAKRKKHAKGVEDEDEGGEGGLVKTRAQRAAEKQEKGPLASTAGSTVDVDALWQNMINGPTKPEPEPTSEPDSKPEATSLNSKPANPAQVSSPPSESTTQPAPATAIPTPDEETVLIKRTYKFAGDIITEEKRVPKSSAEAKLYLQQQSSSTPSTNTNSTPAQRLPPLRRPKKRTSLFDPGPAPAPGTGSAGTAGSTIPPGKNTGSGSGPGPIPRTTTGPKLNTIEKSKLDWAGFVDKEGIADELDTHSRAKEGYLSRMDFLGRVDANREEEWRAAKRKNL